MEHLSGKNIFSPILSKKTQWSPFNQYRKTKEITTTLRSKNTEKTHES
jgi:hypothetical protein